MSFTSCGSTRFNRHSCTVANLKVPAMIIYEVETKVLDTEIFPQHNIAGMISGSTFTVVQSRENFTVEKINTHTHTRSPYIDHNINIKMRTLYWSVANLKQAISLKSVSRKSTRITSDEFDLVTKDAYKNVSLKSILANMLFCFCICPIFLLMSEKLVFLCKKCGF